MDKQTTREKILGKFLEGRLAYSEPKDDLIQFSETAANICEEHDVVFESYIDFKSELIVVRANKGFPLDVKPFSRESNTPVWAQENMAWRDIRSGIGRGC